MSIESHNLINICFSVNDNYIKYMAVAVASILKNTKTKRFIDIYVINSGIEKKKLNKIREMITKEFTFVKCNIYSININTDRFSNLNLRDDFYVTIETYYRYVLPSIFSNIKRIIYLDCDIIVLDDIENLYNMDIDNYYLAAVQDIIGFENQKRLKINEDKKYYYCNAGVLLIDLQKFRENNIEEKLFNITEKMNGHLYYQDQDAINIVLEKNIKYLDLSYNLQTYPNAKVDYSEEEYNIAINNPKIIHFIGGDKPWNIGSKRMFRDLYFKYLKYTSWKMDYFKVLFAEKIFGVYEEGIYRIYLIFGIKIVTKPLDLKKKYWRGK